MNAGFFALAFTAALNPKLLATAMLLIENQRLRAMFLCLLPGGLTMALTIGLLDVLVFHANAIEAQGTVGTGSRRGRRLAVGGLLATGRLHCRRKTPAPDPDVQPEEKDRWAQRVLREPRLGSPCIVRADRHPGRRLSHRPAHSGHR